MKKIVSNRYFLLIIGIILFFLLWEIVALIVGDQIMIFPGPIPTIKEAFNLLGKSTTYLHILNSFKKMLIGFVASFVLALILGIVIGSFTKLNIVFKPTIIAIKALPTAAVVLLLLTLFGAKNTPIYIVGIICFPILLESVIGGYRNIPPKIINNLIIDNKGFFEANFKVKIPLALPYLIVGIASSFALSFKIEIMSEVIAGSTDYGLGAAMVASRTGEGLTNIVPLFGYVFIAIAFCLLVSLIGYIIRKKVNLYTQI